MNASIDVLTLFLFNIVLVNIPLLYGTVGEIVTEKAGSLNLGVEGTMAIGAIFGYLAGGTSPAPRPACACAPWGRTPALPTRWASTSCCISTST